MASNPEFSKGLGKLTPEKVLASRITHDGQCAPTFMAKYGSQHEFDAAYLKKHGYFGHFISMQDDANSFRFWHPAEIAIVHGIVHTTFLPQELKKAWHVVGNQICLPHALLLVADMFYRLHHFDYSPFVIFSQFQSLRFQGPQVVLTPCPGGFLIGCCETITAPPHISELVRCVENAVVFSCWHPKCGIGFTALASVHDDDASLGDQIDEVVSNGSVSPTEQFAITVLANFEGDHSFAFWCDSNIPCKSIETLWFDHVTCTLVASSNPAQPCIRVVPARQQNSPSDDAWDIVTVYVEGELTLWSITPEQPLMYHDKLQIMQTTLYDQFGIITPSQKNRFDIVILTRPLEFATPTVSVLYLFAAFREATIELHWDASNHSNIIAIECVAPGLSLLLDFWTSLFAQPQLESLGFRCFIDSDAGCIRFMPIPNIGVIPPAAFQLALGIAAVRSIFALIPVTWPIRARLTWFSRPLWSGLLSSDCTAQMIVNVIRMGLGTTKAIANFSLVHSGRRVALDTEVKTLIKPDQEELVLHVIPELRGGGPSKQQQKLLAKNSIAAVLLEHGHEIGWVKQTVESLHDQFGIPKLQQILVGPTQSQKLKDIKQACSELGISFPTPPKPTNQANSLGPMKTKRRKETELSINPSEYKVDAGFFLTSDNQPATQLNQLRANATGFCLILPSDIAPWLRANQTISADELGAIVLGKIPVETMLPSEAVTMPCTDHSGQSVLLSGTLIQLGSKSLTYAKGDPKQVDAVAGHLMSITLFKDDWSSDRWMDATMNPISFVARALEQENLKECVQAMWGRSLRAGRAQATPAQATTVQIHCTVVDSKKEQLLRASGLNSLFFTPKTRAGRIDSTFKIVWIEGDLAQAIGLATQTPHCLGLVRGRSSYGLKFAEDRFAEAWAKIHPGTTPPVRSVGGLTWKIEGLPFGCTCDMLTSWGSKISWKIVPFKALGPSTWLVRSEQQVPPGLLHFNTTPVLVRHLPARDVDKTPLLVGPRPKFHSQPRDTSGMLSSDPWANYSGPRAQPATHVPAPARTLEGPVASKLKEQDEKIATLQSDLKKMAQQNDKQFAVMDKRMDSSDKQHAAQFGKMEASISSLSSTIDQALQSSVQQNANLMEKKMNELKALFQTKRLRDDKGQDEPMEWLSQSPCHSFDLFAWFAIFLMIVICQTFLMPFRCLAGCAVRAYSVWVSEAPFCHLQFCQRQSKVKATMPRWSLLLLCLLPHTQCCQSFSPRLVPTESPSNKDFALNSFILPLPPMCISHALIPPLLLGVRVGEAQQPGPLRFALINPTSIVSKISQFDSLVTEHAVDIICASETSATAKAQKLFSQQVRSVCNLKSLWSPPVDNQFDRLDGEGSLRGRASGVGVFSKFPCRHALQTIDSDILASARLVHTIQTFGEQQFQVITLYGLASHSPQADQQTDQLLRAALEATDHIRLPTVIAGDFNCDPFSLPCSQLLYDRQLVDLPKHYLRMYGRPMPPTCRETTTPDHALLCPQIASWLREIVVLSDPLFDTHKVVLFSLSIPTQHPCVTRLVLPQSWLEYPIQEHLIAENYYGLHSEPTDLKQWAKKVETAVDLAYQQTQLSSGISPSLVKVLPSRAKGRCIPRKPTAINQRTMLPKSRPGDYTPKFEIHRFATLKMVKQLRRLQNLRRRVAKTQLGGSFNGLETEWVAILWADSPPGGFVQWCCAQPELGPPTRSCPDLDFLHTAEQLLRHYVDCEIDFDHKCWQQKLKYVRFLDAKDQGHSKACSHIRDKFATPVTELKETFKEDCAIVVDSPSRMWAYCDNPSQFVCHAPVQLANCECRVHEVDDHSLLLRPLDLDFVWPDEGQLVQEQVTTRPADIVDKLNRFWMPYWDHPHAGSDMPPDFQAFIQTLPDLPPPVVDLSDPMLWISAVKSLKPHSARGIDGISAAELQSLPTGAITELARILCTFGEGFPAWLMVARTFAVPKCTSTPSSKDIRPITVLAQVYRLWARVVCSQLLQHYSALLPPEIWGLLRGRGPFTASYQMQWWLEKLAFQNHANAGLVLDLVKCFNSIHRQSVYSILQHMGMPHHILKQWSRSLAVLTRSWSLPGFDGTLTACNHGFPEGDVFSVLAMIGVALSWSAHLKSHCPSSLVGAYADNWCFASTRKADFVILIGITLRLVSLLCMTIDWAKTWIWATASSHLASLKHALQQHLPCLAVSKLTTAMDLGSQMTYSGPPRLGKFRNRLSLFKKRCQLLQSMPHDVYTKAHLARTAILPTLYGVALLPLGETHISSMRTHLTNGILGYNHSRNSTLALQFIPGLIDPSLWIILQALEAARRFLWQITPTEQKAFCRVLALHSGNSNACKGPASCLKHYLLRLGWTVSADGLIHVSAFVSLSIFTASKQAFRFWALQAWQQELISFTDRKALKGASPINLTDTRAVLRKLPAGKFARVLQEISGAFQTASQKQKWDPSTGGECIYRQHADSRKHRIFECPATEHIRDRYRSVVEFWLFQSDIVHELPVIFLDTQYELLQTLHWTQPAASFDPKLVETLQQLCAEGFSPTFYTDGSCQYPTLPTVSFAGFSIVLDLCFNDQDRIAAAKGFHVTGITPGSLCTVLVSRTPGAQKIARSELYAVVLILETFPEASILCDSQTTIDRFHTCQANRNPLIWLDSDDCDLLIRMQDAIKPTHRIDKVAAHVDPRFTSDHLQCYHQLGNMVANDSAIKGCWSMHPWFVKECQTKCVELQTFRESLANLYELILDMQQHCAILKTNASSPQELVTTTQHVASFRQFQTWEIATPWVCPPLQLSRVQDSSWGKLLSDEMITWMGQLQWPADFQKDDFGVTWMELVLSYSIHIGCYFPVPRTCMGDKQVLVTLYTWEQLQQFQVKFADLANYFSIFYGQVEKLCHPGRWPNVTRGLVRSLYTLGSATHSAGFVCRPKFPFQAQIATLLREHFQTDKSQAHVAVPKLEFTPRWDESVLSSSLRGDWQKKSLRSQTAMREFQKLVRSDKSQGCRQRTLQFGAH